MSQTGCPSQLRARAGLSESAPWPGARGPDPARPWSSLSLWTSKQARFDFSHPFYYSDRSLSLLCAFCIRLGPRRSCSSSSPRPCPLPPTARPRRPSHLARSRQDSRPKQREHLPTAAKPSCLNPVAARARLNPQPVGVGNWLGLREVARPSGKVHLRRPTASPSAGPTTTPRAAPCRGAPTP